MDISVRDAYGTKQPRGQATTLLDLVSRDLQDNILFPLNTNVTQFTRDDTLRTIPMASVFREFTFRGPAELGQSFVFEIGDINCGDLIQALFIQIKLGDWFTDLTRQCLYTGAYTFKNKNDAWTYSNSLGTIILDEATLEVDDQILEKITGDAVNVVSLLFPDMNTQIGLSDSIARMSIHDIKAQDGTRILPTDDNWITVPLLFSMLRERLTATFPLIACRAGTMRVRVKLKKFDQIVRILTGQRKSGTDTPLGKITSINDTRSSPRIQKNIEAAQNPPDLKAIQLLTSGVFVDGPYREMLLRQPFERPFREIQQFDFNEPLKYVVNKSVNDMITIQLPLEANQPVEEIVWFLRRKAAVTLNNDWVNYSATLEKDYDPTFAPLQPLLVSAKLLANGMEIISQDEAWFRSHISRVHRAGRVAYESYIYGYSFAKSPGEHDPTGTINASRLSSLCLTLDVKPPGGSSDTEWEVHVFVFAFQWIRFGNGICNKVFSD
jgi:Large eukaryotic DNA virus major capsid protein/Major capsid protein N-terminus